jgi:hypothetical protein
MEIEKYGLEIVFLTPVLGSQPQKDVATEFLGSKFVDNGGILPDDELETLDETIEKGTTVFHKVDGKPILFDYQVKGFIKEAGRTFNGLDGVKALRSKIDSMLFVTPRRINLVIPEGGGITYNERPLRAETAQGPRVALARSEELPEGTKFSCTLEVYRGQLTFEIIHGLLTYGAYKGLGQWRNGGYGRFEFTLQK